VRVSTCRSCHAEIIWCRTARGKKMPLDAEPTSAGAFVIEHEDSNDPLTRRLPNDAAATYTGDRYEAHWATCPNADEYRKRSDHDAA
jgi:hypothetical protein